MNSCHINIKHVLLLTGIQFCFFANAAKINGSVNRQDGLYKCGETATFQFAAVDNNQRNINAGEMTLTLSNDGGDVFATETFDLAKNQNPQLSGTLKTPGFLRCYAQMTVDGKRIWNVEGAGYEVEKIVPGAEAPADFDQFWHDAVKKCEEIPLDAKIEKLDKYSNDKYTSYKISFAAPDGRVYGFLCIPNGKNLFPALVKVPPAGPGATSPITDYAAHDIAVMVMNVHSYDPNNRDEVLLKYKELNKKLTYSHHNSNDREKYFFYRAILGINRAVNWLAQRPDINAEKIGYFGSSQGGAFGLILGGLNTHISAVVANVPAMCDHFGYNYKRSPGWPHLVRRNNPDIIKTAGYYDAVNFARKIKCPVRIIVGFGDDTCSPSSVYAAYNVIKGNKHIVNEVGMGHSGRPSYGNNIAWMINTMKK